MLNVHIFSKKKQKKKKKLRLASLGKFISSGTELSPLSLSIFPFSNLLWKGRKKGGGNVGRLPVNGELVADLDRSGFSDPRSNGPVLFCFCYEFTEVPSCLPADQAVVIQQLSIG